MIKARTKSQADQLCEDDLYLIEESETEVTLSLKNYSSGARDDIVFEDKKVKLWDNSNSNFNEKCTTKAEYSVDFQYGGGEQIAINFKDEEDHPNTSTFSEENINGKYSAGSQFINDETVNISSEDDEGNQSNKRSSDPECIGSSRTWYTCHNCCAKLTTEKYRNDHEIRCGRKDEYYKGRTFDCSHCQLAYTTEDGKNEHEAVCKKRPYLKMHSDDTPQPSWKRYSCDKCSYETIQKHHFIRHMRTHDKKYAQNTPTYSCEYCAFQTTYKGYLKRHVRRLHSSFGIICNLCQKSFKEKLDLECHYVAKHPDRSDKWKDIVTHKIHECPKCDYRSVRIKDFKFHLATHDTGADKYKFNCKICNYKCVRKANFTRHLLSHSGQGPYVCIGCNGKFVKKGDLTRHIITQHSLNKALMDSVASTLHYCDKCNFKTIELHSLKRHVNSCKFNK